MNRAVGHHGPASSQVGTSVALSATRIPHLLRVSLLTAAVLACLTASAGAAAPPATGSANCGRIGFEPQTDNVAANIRARGTSCRRARRIVRAVYNGNRGPFGYRCRSRLHDDGGLAFRHWVCTKNQARVTWDKY